MANKPPAFQFYVKDWLSSSTVRAMSLAARGAYIDLLAFAWQSQPFATLPNDPAQLRRLVGADSAEWADIWPQISGCFEVEDGHLVNRRLQDEARKREEFIKKQQANGAKGGRPSKNPGLPFGLPQSEANNEARESSAVFSLLLIQVQLLLQATRSIQQEVNRMITVNPYGLRIQIRFSSAIGLTS